MNADWMNNAACVGANLNMFFPDTPGDHGVEAKKVCKTCPVKDACLQHALVNDERGIWGGTTDNQRKTLRRTLGIERPRYRPECGTTAAYAAHSKAGEEACALCKRANAVARARYRENLRLKAL